MAKKTEDNYECRISVNGKPCGEVRSSIQAIGAHAFQSSKEGHGKRTKGFKVTSDMYRSTTKEAKPSTYNPAWGKKRREEAKAQATQPQAALPQPQVKAKPNGRKKMVQSPHISNNVRLKIPVVLEIECNFGQIKINQLPMETPVIKLK